MKKYVNGEIIELTAEEEAAFLAEQESEIEPELTIEEILQILTGVIE